MKDMIKLLLAAAFLVFALADTVAKPTTPTGGTCKSTGTGRQDTDNGYNCLWDTCNYTVCESDPDGFSMCTDKVAYSNPRDCKKIAARPKGEVLPKASGGQSRQ